jgi:hypothetical protein
MGAGPIMSNSNLPQKMTGLYFINGQLWIIADHPNAEQWRAQYPDMPSANLTELERMPIKEPTTSLSDAV